MSNYSHGVMTAGASRKRKQRDGLDAAKGSTAAAAAAAGAQAEPISDNRLLAGYLAHEFLTRGTLFGQKWDPALADSVRALPPRSDFCSSKKQIWNGQLQLQAEPRAKARAYADMAHLLKTDGAHIPGIVNPTQLGRWIQM